MMVQAQLSLFPGSMSVPSSFGAYVEAQTELFIESLQVAADDQWHLLRWQMNGASEEEIGIEMERWWHGQIRRFQARLHEEHRRGRERLLKRRLRQEMRRRIDAENRLESFEIQLQQTKDSLAADREAHAFFREQWRCRDCGRQEWG